MTSSSLLVPVPFYGVYRASNAAVAALSETLAVELGQFGIKVVEILPGPIDTDMLAGSDRLAEGARYPGYERLAEQMLEGRRLVRDMITPPRDAAEAIVKAVLDDDTSLRRACDPLGGELLRAPGFLTPRGSVRPEGPRALFLRARRCPERRGTAPIRGRRRRTA